jgi:hypothetical protein
MDALYRLSYKGKFYINQIMIIFLERVKGIEPSWSAWEAGVLPLNYTRRQCARQIIASELLAVN